MRLIILFSLLIASTGFSAKETSMADFSRFLISASVYYEVFSHSNPERKPNTAHEAVELIQFAKGEFLGAIKKQTYPLFAEIPFRNITNNIRLQIKSYDPETGFIIFQSKPFIPDAPVFNIGNKSGCGELDMNIAYPEENRETPRVYIKTGNQDRKIQSGFYFSGNTLCGMQSGDGILHRDYILHFLQNQGIGTFIPGPGFSFRHKLTPEEKDFYSLKRETGVIVEEVFPGSGGYNILFPGDSIVAVNGIALKKFSEGDLFQEVLKEILLTGYGLRKRDSPVRLSVYRNRKKMEIEYHLIPLDLNQKFIPENLNLQKEKFILTGGFVFTELSGEYLKEHGEDYKNNSNRKLLYLYENYRGKKNPEKERLVILAKVIESENNRSYSGFQDMILNRLNGTGVRSIGHLQEILKNSKEDYFHFEFSGGGFAVFNRAELKKIDLKIREVYGKYLATGMD